MANSTLGALTAATAATGGLFYGTQSGADRKFTSTAAGAALLEAANAAAQRTLLSVLPLSGGTLTGALINSANGAANTPVVSLTGTTFTGGTATTTKPTLLVEPSGITSTGWSTSGTLIGANAATGFTGRLLDLQVAGSSKFSISSAGQISSPGVTDVLYTTLNEVAVGSIRCNQDSGTIYGYGTRAGCIARTNSDLIWGIDGNVSGMVLPPTFGVQWASAAGSTLFTPDLILRRAGAASLQLGVNHATTPTAQTLKAHNVTTGTGANLQLCGGTGSVASGGVVIGTNGTSSVLIRHGTATLASGTVTVSDTNIAAGSRIFVTRQTDGGVIGDSYSITRSAGTSFTITSKTANVTVTGDTSTVSYLIINP